MTQLGTGGTDVIFANEVWSSYGDLRDQRTMDLGVELARSATLLWRD